MVYYITRLSIYLLSETQKAGVSKKSHPSMNGISASRQRNSRVVFFVPASE